MLEQENRQMQSGSFSSGNREFLVETGGFLHSAEEVGERRRRRFQQPPGVPARRGAH